MIARFRAARQRAFMETRHRDQCAKEENLAWHQNANK